MFKLLHTCELSSGYHPKTNDQSECTNKTLEQYLRCSEFAYYKLEHSFTRYSPFFANIGYHPRWTMLKHLEFPTNPDVEDPLTRLQEIQAIILQNLCDTQNTGLIE
jgi:hypothetical protein